MEEHAGKPSQITACGTPGKREEEQRREERRSMWKGKGEDSEGTRAEVQGAVPADSIQALLLFFSFRLSSAL